MSRMERIFAKLLPGAVLAGIFLVLFPPLGEKGHAGEELPPDGPALYEKYCASCHLTLAKTLKPNRSVRRIRSAIRHFYIMSQLSHLSNAEIEAIAQALATPEKGR